MREANPQEEIAQETGPVKLGEKWQIGDQFYEVYKIMPRGRVAVKPVKVK